LIRPTSGRITFYGRPADFASHDALCRIGSLVESPSYYPHLTGKENLDVNRRLRGLPARETVRVLKVVGLENHANRLARDHSQGMRQRLGLGMAMLGDPDLIILDEPTNGLDPAGIHEIRELLRELSGKSGITIFLSSHLLSEVEQIATQVGILNKGKLIFQGTPENLHNSYSKYIVVMVDRPVEAIVSLREGGWLATSSGDSSVQVAVKVETDAAVINAFLFSKGFKVYSLNPEQVTLEQIFLQLTHSEASQ
jgi:ABC-type multidrug transport system ATPase subunit